MVRGGRNGRIMDAVIYTALILLSFTTLYPLWNTLVISFNEGSDTTLGGLTLWPRQFTTYNYEVIFSDPRFFKAISISVARTNSRDGIIHPVYRINGICDSEEGIKGQKVLYDSRNHHDVFSGRLDSMVHLAATAWVVRQLPCPYHSVGHQRLEYDRVPHVLPGLARRAGGIREAGRLQLLRLVLPDYPAGIGTCLRYTVAVHGGWVLE